jgi:hypothetical protein
MASITTYSTRPNRRGPGDDGYQRHDPALTYLLSEDPALQKIGDWYVLCLGGKLNAVGRVDLKGHCRVEKYDFLAIAWVDRDGPRIVTTKSVGSPCDNSARHAGVDGQPIEDLPLDEQVKIKSRGSIFARETQRDWPYCTIKIEETKLDELFFRLTP